MQQENKWLVGRRFMTNPDEDVWATVEWSERDIEIGSYKRQGLLFPESWSDTACQITASKYLRPHETGLKDLIDRVVSAIDDYGLENGWFVGSHSAEESRAFRDELTYILLHQMAAFNSPVWFNVGLDEKPQASACFILSVEDSMASILDAAKTEGMLFKYGSGSGTNLSNLRSSVEGLAGGGTASGPVSFMAGFDSMAGAIKSGGKTRRAAIMRILNADHPDIELFVDCKAIAERKAHALVEQGYSSHFDDPTGAYANLAYQNANHSVRVTDQFMHRVLTSKGEPNWPLRAVTTGEILRSVDAEALFNRIAEAAHLCGDPGIQFDDAIQAMHTVPNSGRINASNPCSEYMHVDDSACNLASINLVKFLTPWSNTNRPGFRVDDYRHVVRVMITAMDILVDLAGYPTEKIAENSRALRPLGLGYANLGALLMRCGFPYDSEEGRGMAAALAGILTGTAYAQSGAIAQVKGAFERFRDNQGAFRKVIENHAASMIASADDLPDEYSEIHSGLQKSRRDMLAFQSYRNSQASVMAPTGTIAFLMDCDTTGVEPDMALFKIKRLVGGGELKIVNQSVERALLSLGFSHENKKEIMAAMERGEALEDIFDDEHKARVFHCAMPDAAGACISPMGHLLMVAAIQPHVSGAISKTINLPKTATVDDIRDIYIEAWRRGLKAVSIYRDGCKASQPLSAAKAPADNHKKSLVSQLDEALAEHADACKARDIKAMDDAAAKIIRLNGGEPFHFARLSSYRNQALKDSKLTPAQSLDAFASTLRLRDNFSRGPRETAEEAQRHARLIQRLHGESTVNASPNRRERLPADCPAHRHKFSVAGHKGYLIMSELPDGRLGEIFVTMAKEGSTVSGFVDALAKVVSISLQHRVSVDVVFGALKGMRFEPSGPTHHERIPAALSIVDYIARVVLARYGAEREATALTPPAPSVTVEMRPMSSEPTGDVCGECHQGFLQRTGACVTCGECGYNSGCG